MTVGLVASRAATLPPARAALTRDGGLEQLSRGTEGQGSGEVSRADLLSANTTNHRNNFRGWGQASEVLSVRLNPVFTILYFYSSLWLHTVNMRVQFHNVHYVPVTLSQEECGSEEGGKKCLPGNNHSFEGT